MATVLLLSLVITTILPSGQLNSSNGGLTVILFVLYFTTILSRSTARTTLKLHVPFVWESGPVVTQEKMLPVSLNGLVVKQISPKRLSPCLFRKFTSWTTPLVPSTTRMVIIPVTGRASRLHSKCLRILSFDLSLIYLQRSIHFLQGTQQPAHPYTTLECALSYDTYRHHFMLHCRSCHPSRSPDLLLHQPR